MPPARPRARPTARVLLGGALLLPVGVVAQGLPSIQCVGQLRRARIERDARQDDAARQRIEAAVELPGCELPALTALLRLLREGAYPEARGAELRRRLSATLEDPGVALPGGLVSYLAALPGASPAEDALLLDALSKRLESAETAGRELRHEELAEILAALAALQERLGRPREALVTVDRLLVVDGSESWRWRGLALAQRLEDWPQVASRIESLLALPGAGEVLRSLYVRALAHLGRFDEMLRQLDRLAPADAALPLAAGPGALPVDGATTAQERYVRLLVDAAWALRDGGRDAEAEQLFRRVLAFDPQRKSAQLALLYLYGSEEERAARAAAVAERRQQESDPHALFAEGSELLAAGDAQTAVELLARAAPALEGTVFAEPAWYDLGLAAYKLERWHEAADAFGRAAELNPQRPESFFQRGIALVRLDRCADAVPAFERSLELQPEKYQARYYLARCYESLGDTQAAEREWARYHRAKGDG